jgi:mannose-6-phosphate isomerase-like protein (cupin superfamily)
VAEVIMIAKRAELSVLLVVMPTLAGLGCTSPTAASSDEKVEARSSPGALESRQNQGTSEPLEGRSSRGGSSSGLVTDIEKLTEQNSDFRHVIYTAKHSQLVVMALPPGEHIGAETHGDVDQFFRVEQGRGEALIGSKRASIGPGSALVIPAGTKHDVSNTSDKALKLYTIYSPPQHRDGVVHHTRADAERDTEHFDGRTTDSEGRTTE